MAKNRNIFLTNLGKDLLAEAAKGKSSMEFLKVQLGSGMSYSEYTPEQIEGVKAVEKVEVELKEISIKKEGQQPGIVLVSAMLNTSEVIKENFRNSEIGLIARLKKDDGSYYPTAEGILYTYRNIGEEGDFIPKKEAGEAWSLTYNLATLVANTTLVTPVIKTNPGVTPEEFENHIRSTTPHKNFMNTGKFNSEIQFINVNYSGSGQNIDWVDTNTFIEKLGLNESDDTIATAHLYLQKSETKKLYDHMKLKQERIPREIISHTTDEDIKNYYALGSIDGLNFESIKLSTVGQKTLIKCKLVNPSKVISFITDNLLVVGSELLMKIDEKTLKAEIKHSLKVKNPYLAKVLNSSNALNNTVVKYLGLNWNNIENDCTILFESDLKEAELESLKDAKDNAHFVLSTALVKGNKVYPDEIFKDEFFDLKHGVLDWTNVHPVISKEDKKIDNYVGGKNYLDVFGEGYQLEKTFDLLPIEKGDYFNGFRFNENPDNLISDGMGLKAIGNITFNKGLFNNRSYKPSNENFYYYQTKNDEEFKGMFEKVYKGDLVKFDFWMKAYNLPESQVVYNEYKSVSKTYDATEKDPNTVFFLNFDGDTEEEQLKDKISGKMPFYYDEGCLIKGGVPNEKATPYWFSKKNGNLYYLFDQEKLGEGDFTFEFYKSADLCSNDGLSLELCYVYEIDGSTYLKHILCYTITGKKEDCDNFVCLKPNVLDLDENNVLRKEWSFQGTNYDNWSFDEYPYDPQPHWQNVHHYFNFNYSKEKGLNIIDDMYVRKNWTSPLDKHSKIGGTGMRSYNVSIPEGAKYLGLGLRIYGGADTPANYGGMLDQVRITKGIVSRELKDNKILPIEYSFEYETKGEETKVFNAPAFKVSVKNNGTGKELVYKNFEGFEGEGDSRVAKVKTLKALINDFEVDKFKYVSLYMENNDVTLYVDGEMFNWSTTEERKYRFPEQDAQTKSITYYNNVVIGGDNLNDLTSPTSITEAFDGVIQDIGMSYITSGTITNFNVPCRPLLDGTATAIFMATKRTQAIPMTKIDSVQQKMLVVSGEIVGNTKMLFATTKPVEGAEIQLLKMVVENTGNLGFEPAGKVKLVKENGFAFLLLMQSGNTASDFNTFYGKQLESYYWGEDKYLYPFIMIEGNREVSTDNYLKDLLFQEIRTAGEEILSFQDSKVVDFPNPERVISLNSEVDSSSVYETFDLKFEGETEDHKWETFVPGNIYTKVKANMSVKFSEDQKETGLLKINSIDYLHKASDVTVTKDNSILTTKPIIWDAPIKKVNSRGMNFVPKKVNAFLKTQNLDGHESFNYLFNVKLINLINEVESHTYNKGRRIELKHKTINTCGIFRKPDAEAPSGTWGNASVRISVLDKNNKFVKNLSTSDWTLNFDDSYTKAYVTILDSAGLEEGVTLNIAYLFTDAEQASLSFNKWLPMDKIADSTFLNKNLLTQFGYLIDKTLSKNSLIDKIYISSKLEIITNRYVTYQEILHKLSNNDIVYINLGSKRKIDKDSIVFFCGNVKVDEKDISLTGGDGTSPSILRVDLTKHNPGKKLSVEYKYLCNNIIEGISDLGILIGG